MTSRPDDFYYILDFSDNSIPKSSPRYISFTHTHTPAESAQTPQLTSKNPPLLKISLLRLILTVTHYHMPIVSLATTMQNHWVSV